MNAKKILLLVMSLMTLAPVSSQTDSRTIPLRKRVKSNPPVITPLSMEEINVIEAYIEDDELVITSQESATVYITVMSATETVSTNHVSLTAGAGYSISTTDWTPGHYTLYIYCNGDLWMGEFEVE